MATCTLIYPISRVILFLLLPLLNPAYAGSPSPNTEPSPLTDSTEFPVNSVPELAHSTGWGEVSVPDGDRRTRSPGTDTLLTSGWDSSDRHRSPPQPNGGPRTRTLPHGGIVTESWTDDSQNNVAYISTTGEPDLQTSTNIISLEKNEMSTSFTPVTKNSQTYLPASSESEENIASNFESANLFVSTSNYISESQNLFFTSSLESEMPSTGGKAGTGNLKRSSNTSPGVSDMPSDIGLYDATVPLNTMSNRTRRYLDSEKSYSERASSISSTDSKILSNLPSVSDRSLNNSTRSYVQASLIEFEGLSSSQENVKELLNNLSNNFEERSTSTYITRSTTPNDSGGLNTITEFTRSLNTSLSNLQRLSSLLTDLKQSLSTPLNDSEKLSTLRTDFKRSVSTLPNDFENSSTSLDGFRQSLTSSLADPERLNTSLNDLKQSISTPSVDPERFSTSLNDLKQLISTPSVDPERFSTSLNDLKQSITTQSVDPERFSTSLNDLKQSTSTQSVDPERFSTSLNDVKQLISTPSVDPERFSTSLNDLKQSISTQSVDPERFSTSLNDLKQLISTPSVDPERFSTSLNDVKQLISTPSVDPEKFSTSLNDLKQSISTQSVDPERFSTSLNDLKQWISTPSVDPERFSTSLNDLKRSINTPSVVPERFSTSLNNFKESLSTSPNYFETLSTSVNDFERINTSLTDFKRSLSSLPKDPERFSTSVYGVKQTLINTLNDVERLSTSQNDFKRSLSSSPVDPERLTDFKRYERSSTNVFESSSSTSSNTSLNISANPFTHAQGDPERSLGTTTNGFEDQSDSEMFSTLQNVSETSLSTSQKKSKWSLSTSSNGSKRSVSSAPNDIEISLNTSPNNLLWSMNTSLDDSIVFLNTSANDTKGLSTSPNSYEKFSISTQNESERHPNMSKGSSGTARNYLKSSSNTSANNSERVLTTSSNIFERSLPNTSVSSPSTVLNYSNISVSSTLNNSLFTLNILLNNPKRSLNTATNQTDGATPATSIPVDFNNVNGSSEEGSSVMSSVPPIDYYTNGSSFTSRAESTTASSHLVPRITDNFLNTTFFSTINNITKFITTTLSSTQSGSQSLMNSSGELNSNFTTANSSETDFVESKTNGTHAARTPPLSGRPEQRTDSPRNTLPKPTRAHVPLSTIGSLKEEAVRTSSTPVVVTFGSNTGSYTVISQVSTDTPKPTLSNITGSEFATTWSSPGLLTSPLPRDKTSTIAMLTTSVIKTTEPGRTRTSATINTWTSIKTSTTTKTSTISSIQTSAMIPTSTRTSDTSTDFPAITMVPMPTTVPPTTIGRAAPEPSTMTQVTTSISQVPTENACISNPCLNGGTCINGRNSRKKCLCPPSWQGMNCSKDVDECLSNPCPSPAKCVNNLGSFSCKCQPGYYFEKGTGCILAKTFAGVLHMANKSGIPRYELEGDILKILNASLFYLNGYYTSVVADLSETNDSVSVLNMFVHSSNVTLEEVRRSVQNYISSCQSNTGSCQIVQSQRLLYKAKTLCSFNVPKCDNATAECNADSGTAECLCKDGYFKYNDMDHSCRACDDGYKLVNGTCTPCLFGFGGFNCKNPYKLITVVIAAAGGGLLLILGIALTITCCRKEKNDITKLIFKSAEFQRSTYAEFPKNPRISVEWGRETIEMQENGSTKNLLQMTDIYYSSGFRGSEVDRNGLHPYSGLPGSRYSCIYTGQYNPSFSSEESRRRDYF